MKVVSTVGLGLMTFSLWAGVLVENGIQATRGSFPAVVKVATFELEKGKEILDSHCTGTLVAPTIVLTAGHCLANLKREHQRISLPGDETGAVDKGILIKQAFVSGQYSDANKSVDKISKQMDDFNKLSPEMKELLSDRYEIETENFSSMDIAFLELMNPALIGPKDVPEIACDLLSPGDVVMFAGYGQNKKKKGNTAPNENPKSKLNFGFNVLSHPLFIDKVYTIESNDDFPSLQLINHGDSGGPLFKRQSQAKVYGVTSTGGFMKDGRVTSSTFSATGSEVAKSFYRSILKTPRAPKALKDLLKKCLK